jgi:hypothetical protein
MYNMPNLSARHALIALNKLYNILFNLSFICFRAVHDFLMCDEMINYAACNLGIKDLILSPVSQTFVTFVSKT